MKSLRVVMLTAMVMTAGILVHAQTAEEIVKKHIEAIGGKEKISAIKTIYLEYDMDVQGTTGAGTSYMVAGKGYRNEVDLGGQKIIQVYTEKGGWAINPFAGQTSPEPLPEEEVKANKGALSPGGPLFDYVALGGKLELEGTEDLNGVKAHKLKLTIPDGPVTTFLIDPNTFYILKAVSKRTMQGQEVELTNTFSDYKKSEYGYVTPGTTEMVFPMFSLTVKSKKVEINKEIDPKIFDMQ